METGGHLPDPSADPGPVGRGRDSTGALRFLQPGQGGHCTAGTSALQGPQHCSGLQLARHRLVKAKLL